MSFIDDATKSLPIPTISAPAELKSSLTSSSPGDYFDATIASSLTDVVQKARTASSQIPRDELNRLIDTTVATVTETLQNLDGSISSFDSPLVTNLYTPLKDKLLQVSPLLLEKLNDVPPVVAFATSAVVTYALASSVLNRGLDPIPSRPYPNKVYDAESAARYFSDKWGLVVARGAEVAVLSLGFGLNLARDYFSNSLSENAEKRAVELSSLLTKLGPSFIKIGQSLSIRTDILSPAYVRGLKTLQDRVPPFPTPTARDILRDELGGASVDALFSSFSDEPVAAASLGQVYRATLRDSGQDVAIKIQRPDIMDQIALDMHLIRTVVPVLKRTFNLNTDLVGIVDTWGVGFVNELDYRAEGRNGMQFTRSIADTSLASVVFAPPVVSELTTDKVLTTEWVDGERLDRSDQRDVTVLCSIAMNTYLTMMLETGVLHCDPHPGNLLRTPDGRLCILDWGMVTTLDPNLQITLIEHMAHLTSADYEEIPQDLLVLGFIPESKAHLIKDSGVVETLADVYGAWTAGGGVAKIDVNKVISQLQDLTVEKGNLFQIPPYFAYIAKSFSVLEGIGLSNDENYSIVNECLPYVSKRLLTDKSERTGGALSTFIFGPTKNDKERIIDYDRVEQLITGFGDYSTSASGELLGKESMEKVRLFERSADQILDLLLTEEETPLQAIFLEQLAKIMTSTSKSIWEQLRESSGKLPSGRTVLGTLVDPLGFWRTSPVVKMDELDEKTITTTRNLLELLSNQADEKSNNRPLFDVSSLTNEEVVDLSSILVRKVWERRMGVFETSRRFGKVLIELTADKLESGGEGRRVTSLEDSVGASNDNDETPSDVVSEPQVRAVPVSTESKSRRLEGAKRLLAQLQEESDEAATESTPAIMPMNSST